jgi:hypothetical protein
MAPFAHEPRARCDFPGVTLAVALTATNVLTTSAKPVSQVTRALTRVDTSYRMAMGTSRGLTGSRHYGAGLGKRAWYITVVHGNAKTARLAVVSTPVCASSFGKALPAGPTMRKQLTGT